MTLPGVKENHVQAALRVLRTIIEDPTSTKDQMLWASDIIMERSFKRKPHVHRTKAKVRKTKAKRDYSQVPVSRPDIGNLISKLEQ